MKKLLAVVVVVLPWSCSGPDVQDRGPVVQRQTYPSRAAIGPIVWHAVRDAPFQDVWDAVNETLENQRGVDDSEYSHPQQWTMSDENLIRRVGSVSALERAAPEWLDVTCEEKELSPEDHERYDTSDLSYDPVEERISVHLEQHPALYRGVFIEIRAAYNQTIRAPFRTRLRISGLDEPMTVDFRSCAPVNEILIGTEILAEIDRTLRSSN
ncbi:hypothetical protein [Candidatus Palauibacter irciniicola]|uniref:hypothetical protein n=1 Tax=Candidatus Palauibacter irciniicola TaxID=3056733 RepID=UPI003B024580